MTKRQEHIRRWLAAAGPRIVAVAATAGSLGLVCTALAATVNTVTVADSAGAQRTVMAAVTEPEVLLDLAGMELESNEMCIRDSSCAACLLYFKIMSKQKTNPNPLSHKNKFEFAGNGEPSGIRTPDTLLKRQMLCRLS